MLFGGCGKAQHILLCIGICQYVHRGDHWSAFCQRSCLIKGHHIHEGKTFERIASADEDAAAREIANCCGNGGWRGEDESTGAEYHERCHCTDEVACAPKDPECKDERYDDEPGCPLTGKQNNGGFARIHRAGERDDALEGGIMTGLFCTHGEYAIGVYRAAHHRISRAFINGHGFACHDRWIHGSFPFCHDAIDRDRLPCAHAEQIAAPYLLDGNRLLFSVAQHMCGLRHEAQQTLNPLLRARNGPVLKKGSNLHDECNFACCKIFLYGNRGDERDGDKNTRAYIKAGHDTAHCDIENGGSAEQNGKPCGIKGENPL